MDWVKLHTRFYADPKVAGLGDSAELMFVRGLAYAGDQETGGFIPKTIVTQLTRRKRADQVADELVLAGLWTRCAGGWQVARWNDHQDALDSLSRRRQLARERKRRQRDREKSTSDPPTSDVTRDVTRPSRAQEGEVETDLPKGGMSTHDPPVTPCPPRTCQRHRDDPSPPNCGQCADARRRHDAWQTTNQPPPPPPAHLPPPVDAVLLEPVQLETDGKGLAAARQRLAHPTAPQEPRP